MTSDVLATFLLYNRSLLFSPLLYTILATKFSTEMRANMDYLSYKMLVAAWAMCYCSVSKGLD